MNTKLVLAFGGLLLVAGVVYAVLPDSEKEMMAKGENSDQMETVTADSDKEMALADKDMMNEEVSVAEMKKDTMMKAGSYEAYSAEKLAMAESGDVVLFFHAAWCPSCRGLNSDIEKEMAAIPEGVTILKLDYDKETELKKKYGVTTQHTLVQVDKDGNLIKKWSGGSTLGSVLAQIQ